MNIINKNPLTLLGLFILIVSIPVTVYLVQQRQEIRVRAQEVPVGIDLDVTYIERVPRYFRYCVSYRYDLPQLCSGTENQKRWPDNGELVSYRAHIINKGSNPSGQFNYQWFADGVLVLSGSAPGLAAGQEAVFEYRTTWPLSSQTIQFKVDTSNSVTETVETNNSLSINSRDLTISIWVERGLYDIFNRTLNLVGSYSFEDWIQAQFAEMNKRFSQAKYSTSPDGIRDRVRIDKIVVAEELDGPGSLLRSDPDLYLIDGKWQFVDNDPTNRKGENGEWQNYVNQFATNIDRGLIHELAHQLGIIDLYALNVANDPANNCRVQVRDLNGNLLDGCHGLPQTFPHGGAMAGGDTSPYNDGTYFESHTAAGMNAHYNFRRGYYGEYLFDTPTSNYLKILDIAGNPLVGVQVGLYQKNASTGYFDNIPEITGTTNGQGVISLPNRPVTSTTTATGHTLRDNPFGQINVVGTNGVMLVKITKGTQENYRWFTILDLNLAYWAGNTNSVTYTINTQIFPGTINPTNLVLNKPATASGGSNPQYAVDGDKTTPNQSWEAPSSIGSWWKVDLGNNYNLYKFTIYPRFVNPHDWYQRFHIEVSTTGAFAGEQSTVVTETNWDATRGSSNYASYMLTFSVPARYIRIVSDITQSWVELQEFEIYAVTSEPTPTSTPTPSPTVTPSPIPTPTLTPTPTPRPQVTSVTFNGQPLDLSGRTVTSTRLTQGNPINVPVIIQYNNIPARNLIIKFNYQPPATPTPTPTPTPSPSPMPSPTPTPTPSLSPAPTSSPSPTPTPTPTPTSTPTPSPTVTPSPIPTPTLTPTPSLTPTPTPVTVSAVTFNGSALDLTGADWTAVTLSSGTDNIYDGLVDVIDTTNTIRHLVIKFIYQPILTPTPTPIQNHDLNDDGVINSFDIAILFNEWRKRIRGEYSTVGDFNNDGVINSIDYSMLRNRISY